MNRTKLAIALFLIFVSLHLKAQNQTQIIRGIVVDEDTQIPLVGATVAVINSEPAIGAITNGDGAFRLENVKIGRTTIKVTYLGYEDVVMANLELNSAKETVLDIGLVESIVSMEEVDITATQKKGAALNEMATVSARSISAEQTSRYAGGFNDPAKITGNFAGVTNTQDGGNDIVVRGNSPKYVQWRLEGAEITTPNHFGDPNSVSGSVGVLNNNLLSNSDFYTAAFPSEFGNALSGVYDVRMRKGNNEKFEGIFGLGLLGSDITVEGPFKKGYQGSYLANFRYSTIGLATDLGFVPVEGVSLKFQDAAFKLFLPTKKLGIFSAFGIQGRSSFQFLDINPGVLVTPGNDFAQSDIEEDFEKGSQLLNVGVNHLVNLSPKGYLKTTLLYSQEGIEDQVFENIINADSTTDRIVNYKSDLKKISYRLSSFYKHKINAKNKLLIGFQYTLFAQDQRESLLDPMGNRQSLVDFEDNIGSFRSFMSWKYMPTERLSFVTGLHNTNVTFNGKHTIEPRVGMDYRLNSSTNLTMGFGMHSRMESIHNYFARVEQPNGAYTTPNLDLGLLKSNHYVVGIEKFLNHNLHLKLEAYYQDLSNIPVENDPNSIYSTLNEGVELNYVALTNEGSGRNYGVEFTFERFLQKGFYFLFNTSLYESKYTALDGVERNSKFNGNYLINALVGKEFPGIGKKDNQVFAINLKGFLGGGRYYIPLLRDANGNLAVDVPNGMIFDFSKAYEQKFDDLRNLVFSMSYKWNKKRTTHELFLNIDNLTNNQARLREYYDINEPGGVAYERQVGIIPNFLYRIYF